MLASKPTITAKPPTIIPPGVATILPRPINALENLATIATTPEKAPVIAIVLTITSL